MQAEAQAAVESIDKLQLEELRSMPHPPAGVELALEAVMVVIGKGGDHKHERGMSKEARAQAEWKQIRKDLHDPHFLSDVLKLDASTISKKTLKQLQSKRFLANPDFNEEHISHASLAAGPLCVWLQAQVFLAHALIDSQSLEKEMRALEESLSGQREEYEESMRRVDLIGATAGLAAHEERLKAIVDGAGARAAELAQLEEQLRADEEAVAALQSDRDAAAALVAGSRTEDAVQELIASLQKKLTDLADKILKREAELERVVALSEERPLVDQVRDSAHTANP